MLGNALSAQGLLAEAERVVQANFTAARTIHGEKHVHYLGSMMNMAMLKSSAGKYREAEDIYTSLSSTQREISRFVPSFASRRSPYSV